jgi:hypothetical protein
VIKDLRRRYATRYGNPVVWQVDTAIFTRTYFTHCMKCDFCNDQCCSYGVDVDLDNVKRIQAYADEIEQFTGIPRAKFFTGECEVEVEYPGGGSTRTSVDERGCIFLVKGGRGCMLHGFALSKGLEYQTIKPMMSSFFPITFGDGMLTISEEVDESSLACLGEGPCLYDGVRGELGWYFGNELLEELDAIKMTRKTWAEKPEPKVEEAT